MGCSRSKHADGEGGHDEEPVEGEELDLQRFCGKWYVVGSTLPLWRENMRPSMEYTLLEGEGGGGGVRGVGVRLRDEVTYIAPGKANPTRVLGVDTVVGRGAFVWRGAGLLRLISSRWRVAYLDPDYRWAISSFQKTLFTPRGVDIIAREPHMPRELYNVLLQKLRDDSHLSFMAEDMFRPQQGELGVVTTITEGDENVSSGNTPVARYSMEEKGKEQAEPTPDPSPRHPHSSHTQPTSTPPPPPASSSQPRASRFSASTSEITPEVPL